MKAVAYVHSTDGTELLSITPFYERSRYDGRTIPRPEAMSLVWDWAEQGYQIDVRYPHG